MCKGAERTKLLHSEPLGDKANDTRPAENPARNPPGIRTTHHQQSRHRNRAVPSRDHGDGVTNQDNDCGDHWVRPSVKKTGGRKAAGHPPQVRPASPSAPAGPLNVCRRIAAVLAWLTSDVTGTQEASARSPRMHLCVRSGDLLVALQNM